MLYHADACLLEVACLGLGDVLFGHFLVTELDCAVAFLFLGHLSGYHTGACLDNGYRNDLAHFVEDLRHADLLADNGFLHYFFLLRLLVASLRSCPEAGNLTRPHSQVTDYGSLTWVCGVSLRA